MKFCNKCKQLKELDCFCKKVNSKDGYGHMCKICVKEYNDNYDYKQYTLKNKDKIVKKSKQYYIDNKEQILNKTKDYFDNHKEEHRNRTKKWYQDNKEYHQTKTKIYIKKRLKEDPTFKLKETLRKRLYDLLIRNKTPKIYSASTLLGCSVEECKTYLELQFKPEMSWINHGNIWEIDHIKPCSYFDLTNIEQQKQCFHYTNLQPLFKTTEVAESFGYNNEQGNRNKYSNLG
jgi:hypothetical protein